MMGESWPIAVVFSRTQDLGIDLDMDLNEIFGTALGEFIASNQQEHGTGNKEEHQAVNDVAMENKTRNNEFSLCACVAVYQPQHATHTIRVSKVNSRTSLGQLLDCFRSRSYLYFDYYTYLPYPLAQWPI